MNRQFTVSMDGQPAYRVSELLALGLPGVPTSRAGLYAWLKRNHWPCGDVSGKGRDGRVMVFAPPAHEQARVAEIAVERLSVIEPTSPAYVVSPDPPKEALPLLHASQVLVCAALDRIEGRLSREPDNELLARRSRAMCEAWLPLLRGSPLEQRLLALTALIDALWT